MNDTFLYVFVGFVAFTLILRPLLRRHEARRADRRGAVLSAQANAAGLRHELVTDDRAHPGVGVGTHLFSGTTDGLEWSAAVEVTLGDDGQPSRRSVGQRTRLFFPSLTAAPGRFVLAMSLPEGCRRRVRRTAPTAECSDDSRRERRKRCSTATSTATSAPSIARW